MFKFMRKHRFFFAASATFLALLWLGTGSLEAKKKRKPVISVNPDSISFEGHLQMIHLSKEMYMLKKDL